MKPKILIVEDDPSIASFVQTILGDHDFDSDHVRDGYKALEYLKIYHPQLLILDINLPGMSGIELCEQLRTAPATVALPILMLTALGGEKDRVRGLRSGADDYLVKPFSPQELVERIRAILRRVSRQEGVGVVLGAHGIRVYLDQHQVEVCGKPVDLRPKEYDLLITFLKRPGRILSISFLGETVWSLDEVVTRHTVSEHIKNLRKKLGDLGEIIETVPQAGYRLKQCDPDPEAASGERTA